VASGKLTSPGVLPGSPEGARSPVLDPPGTGRYARPYGGHDPGVCGLTFAALTHWMLGRPVQAVATIEAAIALAEQLAHPPTRAIALTWACILHYFARDARATGHYARQVIAVSTEHDLPPWRAAGVLFEGWSRAESGDVGAGVAQVHEGLVAAAQTKGTLMPLEPLYMLVLGDARLKHGQSEEGLRVIDDALAVMASRGEGAFEFHRLKGELELLRSPSNHGPGEACFRKALAVARQAHRGLRHHRHEGRQGAPGSARRLMRLGRGGNLIGASISGTTSAQARVST
jgi:predicted ATPase